MFGSQLTVKLGTGLRFQCLVICRTYVTCFADFISEFGKVVDVRINRKNASCDFPVSILVFW